MKPELIIIARRAGCVTALQTSIWYNGYMQGQSDTYKEVTEDITEGLPLLFQKRIPRKTVHKERDIKLINGDILV